MRKSKINLTDSLRKRLVEFPKIVDSLEKKAPTFINDLLLWIKDCEDLLTTHNLAEAAELSGLRSRIFSYQHAETRRTSARKAQMKIGGEVLYEVQKAVLDVFQPIEMKINEAGELAAQLLAIVSSTGQVRNTGQDFTTLIGEIWAFILANEQLRAGAVKLKTTLSPTDIQLLLAREINLEDF